LACAIALIENSASSPDINAEDNMKQTPLHLACLRGSATIVQLLVESGAEVDRASAEMGTQPVHRAAMGGHCDIVDALLSGGVDANARDEAMMTPVHWASINGHTEVVELLIRYGADLFCKCLSGERAIALAEVRGFNNTAAALERGMGNNQIISVAVKSPAQGEEWLWKDAKDIIWQSSGYSSYCQIDLYAGEEFKFRIAEKAANDGSFSWECPVGTPEGDNYCIKITSLVNSHTFGYSANFKVLSRPPKELEELEARRLTHAITAKVQQFYTDQCADGQKFDGGLLILCLSRPSMGVGKGVIDKILNDDLLSEPKIVGEEPMSVDELIELIMRCILEQPTFEKGLHRRLPRIAEKMMTQRESFAARRQILRDLFNKIDADGKGTIDNSEMQQFFGLSGGATRKVQYTQSQLDLMTEEDRKLLLSNDDFTTSMDYSQDGELQFSEFLRFFLQHHPDGTQDELYHNLQDLGYFRPTSGTVQPTMDLGSIKIDARDALQDRFKSLDFDGNGSISLKGALELEEEFGIPNAALSSTAGTWENERLPLDEMFRLLEECKFLGASRPSTTAPPAAQEGTAAEKEPVAAEAEASPAEAEVPPVEAEAEALPAEPEAEALPAEPEAEALPAEPEAEASPAEEDKS